MKISVRWEERKEESNANIQSETGDPQTPETFHPDRSTLWGHYGKRELPEVQLSVGRKSI